MAAAWQQQETAAAAHGSRGGGNHTMPSGTHSSTASSIRSTSFIGVMPEGGLRAAPTAMAPLPPTAPLEARASIVS
jgi:hypothetical protein